MTSLLQFSFPGILLLDSPILLPCITLLRYTRAANLQRVFQLLLSLGLLYGDNCKLVVNTLQEMQIFVDHIFASCKEFGLSVRLDKTDIVSQTTPGNPSVKLIFLFEGTVMKVMN